jgi:sugar lactone lactonase YvrE
MTTSQSASADLAVSSQALLGEGPLWSPLHEALFWTDINGQTFNRYNPGAEQEHLAVQLNDRLCAFCVMPDGHFLCAFSKDIVVMDVDGQIHERLQTVEADKTDNRFNDGKCDPQGRFWVGTMSMAGKSNEGSLYRVDPDGSVHHMLDGLTVSNGLGWSPDGKTFYLTDSPRREIYSFDFDPDRGQISNRKVFAKVDPDDGFPDGLTIDSQGGIWSAHWDGGKVTRYTPDGVIDCTISVPVPRPTSAMLGGADFKTLYITSARIGLDDTVLTQAPLSGSVFSASVDVPGRKEPMFSLIQN